ncbi:MAG: hypothetical protein DWI22_13260 [Planctomycetota bacterium]|nr:MAG: hypothetical protein DWI22_13260 [Planctomycetota bacterium]
MEVRHSFPVRLLSFAPDLVLQGMRRIFSQDLVVESVVIAIQTNVFPLDALKNGFVFSSGFPTVTLDTSWGG